MRDPEKKPDKLLFNARKHTRLMHLGFRFLVDESAKSDLVGY